MKLCDLGMSKFTDRAMTMNAGGVVGSPCYMPPEAFSTMNAGAAPRPTTLPLNGTAWDVYSLGVLFWWMWHGQDPFATLDNIFMIADVVRHGARPAWWVT